MRKPSEMRRIIGAVGRSGSELGLALLPKAVIYSYNPIVHKT